jgi:hypothetical protein
MNTKTFNSQFVKDKDNKPVAVVLDIDSYKNLMEYIEDLEDALEIDRIVTADDGIRIPLENLLDELKSEGLWDATR